MEPARHLEPVEPPKRAKVPKHLRAQTRRWYESVLSDYDLEDHHHRLLQAAAEAWDRLQEARETLAREGIVVEGRYGPRAHPAVAIERDARTAFARLLRELDLDGEPTLIRVRRGGAECRAAGGRTSAATS